MRDGSQVPDFIFISVLPDGERVIELDSASLPPGHGAVFEVALRVFDPNSEATQLIPISVKCPEPTTGLQLVRLNFESPVDYQVGSKPTIIKVPSYQRSDGEPLSRPVMITLTSQNSTCINQVAQLMQDDQGEQFIMVQTGDPLLIGEFKVKIYATEQSKGLTNQQAQFLLRISESVLALAEEPSQFYRGTKVVYVPNSDAIAVPLPKYTLSSDKIEFSLTTDDGSPVPPFARLEGDHLVIEGCVNPDRAECKLTLVAFEPESETRDELPVRILCKRYVLEFDRLSFQSPVEFRLGDTMELPLPLYRQSPFKGEVSYRLDIKGIGVQAAGVDFVSIEQKEGGQRYIRLAGGSNDFKGTYQVNVVATERTLGVTNSEAFFVLEAVPQLRLKNRPAELDEPQLFKVSQVHTLPVPTYESSNLIRYTVVEKDEELAPEWISVKAPRSTPPYIEIKCTQVPSKAKYEFELTASDYKQHVENVQPFTVEFDMRPSITLETNELPLSVNYGLRDELELALPEYGCYLVDRANLKYTIIRQFDRKTSSIAKVDLERKAIVVHETNSELEGPNDIVLLVKDTESHAMNDQVAFRVEIGPAKDSPVSIKKASPIHEQFLYNDEYRIGGEAVSQIPKDTQSDGEHVVDYSFQSGSDNARPAMGSSGKGLRESGDYQPKLRTSPRAHAHASNTGGVVRRRTNSKQMFPEGLSTKEGMTLKQSPGPTPNQVDISMRDNKDDPQFRPDHDAKMGELQRENANLRQQIHSTHNQMQDANNLGGVFDPLNSLHASM